MKMQFKLTRFILLLFVGSSVLFVSCKSDNWTEHYSINEELVPGQNLWEMIQQDPTTTKFAWAVRKTGYDKVLSGSQMYTVWAPSDSSAQNIDTTDASLTDAFLLKNYVQNHISRFSYPASGTSPQRIELLNKKVILFNQIGGDYLIGTNPLTQKNMLTSNGLLHHIGNKIPFSGNIWELMDSETGLDSLRTFFHSYDRIVFDASRSIPGPDLSEDGRTIYIDSVTYNYNSLFYSLGELNNEDSTYSVLLPNNTAWINAYEKIKEFYRYHYFSTSQSSKYNADTLQRQATMINLVKDLIFRDKQVPLQDSLVSTTGNYFQNPFSGAVRTVGASNGSIHIVDSLPFKSWQSWNKEIRVEAERTTGRINTSSLVYERNYTDTSFMVSKNKYLDVSSSESSVNPTVTFDIPHTLSGKLNPDSTVQYGAAYNIYCVFAPNSLNSTTPLPCKVYFTIYSKQTNGLIKNQNFTNKSTNFITSTDKMTKVLVCEKFVFPVSEYGMEIPNVKLKVVSNVNSAQMKTYSRDMLLDCIILEPVQQ